MLLEAKQANGREPSSDYLGAQEAADYLKIPLGTIYNLVHRRAIPYRKRGKRLYFNRLELKEIIESGKRKTIDELESFAEDHLQNLPVNKK